MITTGHSILQIVKGVQKVPGNTANAEQGLDSIDLLDPKGFSLDTYEMKIPALKSSAVYADSPLSDGRTLIAGTLGNVTETLRITLSAGTIVQLAAMLSKLLRFKQDCNDFWDTRAQIEPVYIKHQVNGEPGPRYALLYDIDIAIESPTNPSEPTRDLTIVIEREYGWRGLAPGDNPKRWTIEEHFTGQKWDSTDADLQSGGNHLVDVTIQNRLEWNPTNTVLLSQNYFDIPASSIPGDLPALMEFSAQCVTVPGIGLNRFYIGKSSKTDLPLAGNDQKPNYILVAADGGDQTDAADANDTGGPIDSASGVNRRKTITFATASLQDRIRWFPSSGGTNFEMSSLRGQYIGLLRARLSVASTVTLNLRFQSDSGEVVLPTATLTGVGAGGVGNTTAWQLLYMGVLTFPYTEERIRVNRDGLGVKYTTGSSPALYLQAARTGVATNLYVADLILIPTDEGAFVRDAGESIAANNVFIYDNTGYFLHGSNGGHISDSYSLSAAENRGQEIYLTPRQRNRLVMFADLSPRITGGEAQSAIDASFRFRLNIVPRWAGLRDT